MLKSVSCQRLILSTVLPLFVSCLPLWAFGQSLEPRFDHISTAQGLSQSTVNAILQDRQGFIWFGTQDGLDRFDGYSFTVFREIPSDTQSLSDNFIWCLLQDRNGSIWVGTLNNGLNCYRPDQDRFIRYLHDPSDSGSIAGGNVTALCQDADGDLWVGTWGGGLCRLNRTQDRFTRVHFDVGPASVPELNFVRCIFEDRSGLLWIGTWGGLLSFDRHSGAVVRYQHDPRDSRSLSGDRVVCVFRDIRGTLWVATLDSGLNALDGNGKEFKHFRHDPENPQSLCSDAIVSACQDSTGVLWFGSSDAGVSQCDPQTATFVSYRRDLLNPRSLSSNRVYAMYKDRAGALWIGTADAGVNRYDPNKPRFIHLIESPAAAGGLSHSVVRAICEDRTGDLWIGTAGGGLDRYKRQQQKPVHYHHVAGDARSLSNNSVMVVFEDHTGTVWIGTEGGGLDRFDPASGGFLHYRNELGSPRSISGNSIMSIGEDRDGTLWVGTTGDGLNRYDRKKDSFVQFSPWTHAGKNPEGSVWAIHEDRRGYLWFGTWGAGLRRYDRTTNEIRQFTHDRTDPSTLSNNTVWSIYEDSTGVLWFGTWGGGLDRYDPSTEKFTHFTKADGLPNDVVYGILPDGKGHLWLSTNDGLARFNPATKAVKVYDELDGLQGSEFNQGAYCRGRDGTLYFGGTDGLNAFQPDSIKTNQNVPPIVLTSFKILDRPAVLPRSISTVDEITISHNDDFIAFEFAALDFSAPGKNQYAYRLEGFDRDWISCGTRRYAAYTGLHGGTYLFRVKGSNNDGVWNEKGASVRIIVRPPFWETWWFVLTALLATVLLLYSLYRYRVRQLLEMERLRTRLSSDLHDELASNLSSIALFSNLVRNISVAGGSLLAEHIRLLERITSLSQESVASIRDIIWALDAKPETVYDLLIRLRDTMVPLCRARNIRLTFGVPARETLPSTNLSPRQRKHLWLLLKEVLMNAVMHAGCTELLFQHEYSTHELRFLIRDNGSGFDPSSEFSGKGLKTIKMRAAELGGAVDLVSVPGEGTTVHVNVRA